MLIPDNLDEFRRYADPEPFFGPAPAALLTGLSRQPSLEIHIVACTHQPMLAPARIAGGIHFHLAEVPPWGWLRGGYLGCIRAVRKRLDRIQPDVVHGQGTERWCALAAVGSQRPNVVTIHGIMHQVARRVAARPLGYHWLAARLEAAALRRTHGVICNTAYTESQVQALARRTWRVPNALREDFFRPATTTPAAGAPPRLVNVGAVRELKQTLELLGALEELHEAGAKFRIEFAGKVDAATTYGQQFLTQLCRAEAHGWAAHVGELSLDELLPWLDGAAALIHVSTEESFGLAIAEALARNLKFFGFGAGGVPEVAAGAEGAAVFPLNDWGALSHALVAWLAAGAPRPTAAAAQMRSRFHPDLVARRQVEIYQELLDARRSQAA